MRQCELQGIEASTEIQQAARRVADENKKLRSLLAQHGVGDDSVEAYLQSHQVGETLMATQFGHGSSTGTSTSNASAQILEQMLQTRKVFYAESNTNTPASSAAGRPRSRDSSASASTVHSIWDNGTSNKLPTTHHTPLTPSRTSSSIGSIDYRSSHSISHHHGMNPVDLRHGHNHGANVPVGTQHTFGFNPLSSNNEPSYITSQSGQHPLQYIPINTSRSTNVNNCGFAADMISTMTGVPDPNAIRAELGCLPDMDCEVDNHLVFNVMDRYTGSSVGI